MFKLTKINGVEIKFEDVKDFINAGDGILINKNITKREVIEAAGLDERKVDYAVPQPWAQEYHDKHGEWPNAIWYYGNDSVFGEPVFIGDLVRKIGKEIRARKSKGE